MAMMLSLVEKDFKVTQELTIMIQSQLMYTSVQDRALNVFSEAPFMY